MRKKLTKLLILLLSVITSLTPTLGVLAETIPEKLVVDNYTINIPIEFWDNFHVIKTTTGKFVFCMQYDKYAPNKNITYTKDALLTDNGLNYLFNKSYGIKTDNEYFIYKSAIWLYMVDKGLMEGSHNTLKHYYDEVKASKTSEAKQILALIAEAKKAGANDTKAPTIKVDTGSNTFTLDSTGKYYVSNDIKVTSSTGKYTASLTKAPKDSEIVKSTNSFVIKVPASAVTELETEISFKVGNTKDVYVTYKYKPNNTSYQPIAATYKETKAANATGKLNILKTVSVPFLKIDAKTGEAISGAKLELKNSSGKVIATWNSSTEAKVIEGLKEEKYTLTEIEAPAGYKKVEASVEFSIDSKGNILNAKGEKIVKVVISNEKITGGVLISKRDITTGEELEGATLQIKDANGNSKKEWTWVSGKEPHYIDALEPGTYTLTETIAPAGYVLSKETITFTIKDDGSVEEVVMYNTPITGGVLISKRDITTGEELEGATLQIKDANGNSKKEWTWVSGKEPHYIEKLKPGTYTLTEILQPEGYELSKETITFTIKEDGSVEEVVMYNTPVPKIPVEPTSSFKTMTSTIIGTLIVLVGSYMIIKNTKKKEY